MSLYEHQSMTTIHRIYLVLLL